MHLHKLLTDHDLITLLALASKVCGENVQIKSDVPQPLKQKQLDALRLEAIKTLIRLDKEAPGTVIPAPDNKPWAYR